MQVIGIGGGSGSGKTTISHALAETYPARFEVLTLDDYQYPRTYPGLPKLDGMINWDHPDAIRWQDLRRDVERYKNGGRLTVQTWEGRSVAGQQSSRLLRSCPNLIVEGYLGLYKEIVDMYDKKFYFDLDEPTRYARRKAARGANDTESVEDRYAVKILKPMHDQYVEPTKAAAGVVVPVAGKSVAELVDIMLNNL
jgi:uridine kinase